MSGARVRSHASRTNQLFLASATYTVVWLAAITSPGLAANATLIDGIGILIPAIVATVAATAAARRGRGRYRASWFLLAGAAASFGVAQLVVTALQLAERARGSYAWQSHFGYLATVALAFAALLARPLAAQTRTARTRLVLDGLLIAVPLLYLSWGLELATSLSTVASLPLPQLAAMSYPVCDVVLCTVALIGAVHTASSSRWVPGLIAGGLFCNALAHGAFGYFTQLPVWHPEHALDAGWIIGWSLIAAAALADREDSAAPPWRVAGILSQATAYLPLMAAACYSAILVITRHTPDATQLWLVALAGVVLLVRQLLDLQNGVRLARGLEAMVTARTAELVEREENFRLLFFSNPQPMWVIDTESLRFREVNDAAVACYGWSREDFLDRSFLGMFPAGADAVSQLLAQAADPGYLSRPSQWQHRRKDGTTITVELTTHALLFGGRQAVLAVANDVTERMRMESELRDRAMHDELTSLPNRRYFVEYLAQVTPRAGEVLAVGLLDIDGFKTINDTSGHAVGDELLVTVAARLRACVRDSDTAARLGGDEFAFLFRGLSGPEDANRVAARVEAAFAEPFRLHDRLVRITASLGIALSTHGTSTEELLGNADMAMYAAKAAGRNRATLFETDMHERIRERVSLEYDLVGAIDRGEMAVHYQPIVDLATGRVAAFEALLRWRHPERGNVPPTDFIPLAESNGHIERIGQWVLVQACRQLAAWQRAQRPGELPLRVCVNVSPQQLQSPSFVQQVGTVLRGCEIDPATLTLEITEHLLVTDPDIAGPLTALRELGVRIALDDFGTGYSAFGYLRRMPVHSLKLDRTFVDGLGTDDRQAALASAILHVADALDVEVVAEGIENIDQLQTLRRLGCQYGQGFVFGHGEAAGGRLAVERWVDLRERDSIPA